MDKEERSGSFRSATHEEAAVKRRTHRNLLVRFKDIERWYTFAEADAISSIGKKLGFGSPPANDITSDCCVTFNISLMKDLRAVFILSANSLLFMEAAFQSSIRVKDFYTWFVKSSAAEMRLFLGRCRRIKGTRQS